MNEQQSLFRAVPAPVVVVKAMPELKPELSQWFTPVWAAELLVERFFPDLGPGDLVVEPSCGVGAFLQVIPDEVDAVGVEIDPAVADIARQMTRHPVITGDFRQVPLPEHITAAIGNPPFSTVLVGEFLNRCYEQSELQRCGFVIPSYLTQTYSTVNRWRENWSLRAETIPRGLFPRLSKPLMFLLFERGSSRNMTGFCLYDECVDFDNLAKNAKALLIQGRPRIGVWRALLNEVMAELGGEASLEEIYDAVEPKRPTPNAWWRDKVRQTLQFHFESISRGRWRQPEQEAA